MIFHMILHLEEKCYSKCFQKCNCLLEMLFLNLWSNWSFNIFLLFSVILSVLFIVDFQTEIYKYKNILELWAILTVWNNRLSMICLLLIMFLCLLSFNYFYGSFVGSLHPDFQCTFITYIVIVKSFLSLCFAFMPFCV